MNSPSAFGLRRSQIPRKAVCCPHCSASQDEPVHVQSTYCRACGQYFQPDKKEGNPGKSALHSQKARKALKTIRCFVCGAGHEVSTFAETTMCPGCAAHIDLRNIRISRPVTRMIDTRGALHITREGSLANNSTICGTAWLEGGWTGRLYCDGEARLDCRGHFSSQLIAQKVIVGSRADVRLDLPLHVAELEVKGRLVAPIRCSGRIRILKRGCLEGEIYAKSFTVDKGGSYSGALSISSLEAPAPPSDHPYALPEKDMLRVVRHRPRRAVAPDRE